jgi:AraC-like DNA-binding protein
MDGSSERRDASDARRKLSQVAGMYRERLPNAALTEHVDRIWSNTLAQPMLLEVIPDGCIDIYWSGERLIVAGPNTKILTAALPGPASLVGVRFKPGVANRWLRTPASELLDAQPALDTVWGSRETRELAERIAEAVTPGEAALALERALLARVERIDEPEPVVSATALIAARADRADVQIVRHLVAELGCSERTLRRRCHEAFGYGPKTLQRILRFQRFLRSIESAGGSPLSAAALAAGYADQAHLSREARELSGMSPRTLLAELRA